RGVMADAVFATGTPYLGRAGHDVWLGEAERVMGQSAGVRRWGAASLDLAYVAAGRFDGFWERHLKAWDVAAGAVLVREAGRCAKQIDGGDFLQTGAIVAANERLMPLLTKALRG